jgi:Gpi18-like mannosyltransferase
MPIFAHSDLFSLSSVAVVFEETGRLVPTDIPPLMIYVWSAFIALFKSLGLISNYVFSYMSKINTIYSPNSLSLLFNLTLPDLFSFIFIIKIPYLITDFFIGILFLHFFENDKEAIFSFKLWMANPVSIFISYMVGQYDVIPAFFILASLFFFEKRKFSLSLLSIGMGAAFKLFSILLAPMFLFVILKQKDGLRAKLRIFGWLVMITILPLILLIKSQLLFPPYYLSVNAAIPGFDFSGYFGRNLYYRGDIVTTPLSSIFLYSLEYSVRFVTFPLFIDVIYVFPFLYMVFLMLTIHLKSWSSKSFEKLVLAFLLLYYAFTLFHPQWFLWIQPVLILLTVREPKLLKFYLMLMPLYFVYTWYWDPALSSALFAPITIGSILNWPSPLSIINSAGLPGIKIVNVARSMMSAILIFMVILLLNIEQLVARLKKS